MLESFFCWEVVVGNMHGKAQLHDILFTGFICVFRNMISF